MSKNELLTIAYDYEDEFSVREFDCLCYLIEDGTITTIEELNEYL